MHHTLLPFSDRMDGARSPNPAAGGGLLLPPRVKPMPHANEATLQRMPGQPIPSAMAPRKRSATQVVYLISEQHKNAPEYKEQKRRLIQALTTSKSPSQAFLDRPEGHGGHHSHTTVLDTGKVDAASDAAGSDSPPDSGSSSDTSATNTSFDRLSSGRRISSADRRSSHDGRLPSRKRKELMKALAQPVDDLCTVPNLKLDDALLLSGTNSGRSHTGGGKSPRPTGMGLSPRATHHHHHHHSSKSPRHNTGRASASLGSLPPVEAYTGGAAAIARLGDVFTPLQALDSTLDTAARFLGALDIGLVQELHGDLHAHLKAQVANVLAAVDVARAICVNQLAPVVDTQREAVRTITEQHTAEKAQAAALHGKVVGLQATMRSFGIVPTVHGVHAPDPAAVVIVLCDIPHAPRLWASNPELGQSTMDVFAEAARSLLKDNQAYEVAFGGWSLQLAFGDAVSAFNYCLSLQAKLLGVAWPKRLLAMDAYAPDNKLVWRGLAVRMAVAKGVATTVVDPDSQVTKYFGEPLLMASHLLRYAAIGTIVTTQALLTAEVDVPLATLATTGGAAALTLQHPQEILRVSHTLIRLVPQALRARLQREADVALASGRYFLGITHRPSDLCVDKTYNRLFHKGESSAADHHNFHIPIDDVLPQVLDDLALDEVLLREGLNTSLKQVSSSHLQTLVDSGKPVILMVIKLDKVSAIAEEHPHLFVRTCQIFVSIVRQLIKKVQKAMELSANFDVVTLFFGSRQEAMAFAVKLHGNMAMANWEGAGDVWASSQASLSRRASLMAGEPGAAEPDELEQSTGADKRGPKCRIGIDLAKIVSTDAQAYFLKVSQAAASAAPGETLLTSDFKVSADAVIATIANAKFIDRGTLPLGLETGAHDETVWSLFHSASGERPNTSVLHASQHLHTIAWPNSSVLTTASARLDWTTRTAEQFRTTLHGIRHDRDKSLRGQAACPISKDAVFVSLEAHVTVDMWFSDHKCVLLEALRIFQKAVRVLLIEIEDGYELFSDQQAFLLCFAKPVNAVRFALDLQERLAVTYWGPGFHELFPQCGKVLSSEGSIVWNGLKVRCSVVSQREGITLPVLSDAIRSTGRTVFFGRPVFLCAKLCSLTCFGQILIDELTRDSVKAYLKTDVLRDPICEHSGHVIFAGRLQGETKVFSLVPRGIAKRPRFPFISPGSDTFSAWLNVKLREDVVLGHHVVSDGLLAQTLLKQLEAENARKALPPDSTGLFEVVATAGDDEEIFAATLPVPVAGEGISLRGSPSTTEGMELFRDFATFAESGVFHSELLGPPGDALLPSQSESCAERPLDSPLDSARVTRENSSSSVVTRQTSMGEQRQSRLGQHHASSASLLKGQSKSQRNLLAATQAPSAVPTTRQTPKEKAMHPQGSSNDGGAVVTVWNKFVRLHAVVRKTLEAERKFIRDAIIGQKSKDGPPMTDTELCVSFFRIFREEQLATLTSKPSMIDLNDAADDGTARRFLALSKLACDETVAFPTSAEWTSLRSQNDRDNKVSDVIRSLLGHLASFHITSVQLFRSPGFRKLVSGASGAAVAPRLSPRLVQSDDDDDEDTEAED